MFQTVMTCPVLLHLSLAMTITSGRSRYPLIASCCVRSNPSISCNGTTTAFHIDYILSTYPNPNPQNRFFFFILMILFKMPFKKVHSVIIHTKGSATWGIYLTHNIELLSGYNSHTLNYL